MQTVLILIKREKNFAGSSSVTSFFLVVRYAENLVFRQSGACYLTVNVNKLEMERTNFH